MCSCCCHLSPAATPPHTAATPPQTASTPPQTAPQTADTPPQAVQPGLQAAGQGATEVRVQEAVPGQDSQEAEPVTCSDIEKLGVTLYLRLEGMPATRAFF